MPQNQNVVAIVPAAGSSQRMGAAKPKVLLELGGLSVLERTLRTLNACPAVRRIVVAARESDFGEIRAILSALPAVSLVAGGATRQLSVRNALNFIAGEGWLAAGGFVLVHDAARCMATVDLFSRCIEGAREHGAVTAAIPVVDSIKRVGADLQVQTSLDRSGLWAVQTPQVFDFDLLMRAHEGADPGATDDACLVEKLQTVRVVPGEKNNFKITSPEDLRLAKALID